MKLRFILRTRAVHCIVHSNAIISTTCMIPGHWLSKLFLIILAKIMRTQPLAQEGESKPHPAQNNKIVSPYRTLCTTHNTVHNMMKLWLGVQTFFMVFIVFLPYAILFFTASFYRTPPVRPPNFVPFHEMEDIGVPSISIWFYFIQSNR